VSAATCEVRVGVEAVVDSGAEVAVGAADMAARSHLYRPSTSDRVFQTSHPLTASSLRVQLK